MGAVESLVDLLVPAFREKLQSTLIHLVGQGFSPRVHETLRSRERAQALVLAGKSRARPGLSMHCFGVAADVICRDHQWDCRRHFCRFFQTLGDCAEDNGLTWGGNWDRDRKPGEKGEDDLPHVQLPELRHQDLIRRCPAGGLDRLCRELLQGLHR